jgi:DNA-binding transcriptional LysR family regulator
MDSADIDLFALRSFCVLMDERSVSRAAFRLGLKQPTMSRMLARLRVYFGDSLLVWAGGHMVPTPRALQLEGEVRQVITTMERISTRSQSFDPATSSGTLRLVATGYLESIFLVQVMAAIASQSPGTKLEVRPPDRPRDAAALEKGEIDFLVGWNTTPAPSLRSRVLFTDRLICIARADHPRLRDGKLTYEQYVTLPHVQFDVPGRTTTELLLQERLAQDGHQPNVRFRVQSLLTVANVVASSDLIATLSKRFATTLLGQYRLQILELPLRIPLMQNRAFWHERMHDDPRSRWFRKLLADVAKGL